MNKAEIEKRLKEIAIELDTVRRRLSKLKQERKNLRREAALPKHEPRAGDVVVHGGSWYVFDMGSIHLVPAADYTFTGLNIEDFVMAWQKAVVPIHGCWVKEKCLALLAEACKAEQEAK